MSLLKGQALGYKTYQVKLTADSGGGTLAVVPLEDSFNNTFAWTYVSPGEYALDTGLDLDTLNYTTSFGLRQEPTSGASLDIPTAFMRRSAGGIGLLTLFTFDGPASPSDDVVQNILFEFRDYGLA